MAATQTLSERINRIETFDKAIPFLKTLPLNIIKMFLCKSAAYGFFEKVSFDEPQSERF